MDVLAIAGFAALVLLKEAGVPLPVPRDLLIIGAGRRSPAISRRRVVLAIILVVGYMGASIQFVLFGSALRHPLLAVLGKLGIGEARLQPLSDRFDLAG